jgi:hypothetical protein
MTSRLTIFSQAASVDRMGERACVPITFGAAPRARRADCYIGGVQNWNGATDTVILPADDCWTVKFTSFEAFVSPTVTDIEPLHSNVRPAQPANEQGRGHRAEPRAYLVAM